MRSVRIFTKLYTAGLDYTWIYLQWKRWEKSQKGNDKKNASNNGATPVSVAYTAGRQPVRQTYKFSMQMKNQVFLRHESADPKVGKPTPTVNFLFECRMISAKPCRSPWQQGKVDNVCYFIYLQSNDRMFICNCTKFRWEFCHLNSLKISTTERKITLYRS